MSGREATAADAGQVTPDARRRPSSGADAADSTDTDTADRPVRDARFTHLDDHGDARMVDVGHKAATRRRAIAGGTFRTTRQVIDMLTSSTLPKGDVLATARIAAIMAAKRTDELIPLCHQLALSSVDVDFTVGDDHIDVTVTVGTAGQTGVEMEALTGVAVAGLTLHDMVKAVDRTARMDAVRLLEKTGGKSGIWRRADYRGDTAETDAESASDANANTESESGANPGGAAPGGAR
ncbi:hypothetical protein GCM10009624_17360 [Gordonia sinesedis]